MFTIGLCELAIVLFYHWCVLINRLINNEPQTTIVLKKGEIQRPFIYLCYNAGKHISLIHIVNKSSKFNLGLSEFVIVGYSLFIIINNNSNNEPISIRWK